MFKSGDRFCYVEYGVGNIDVIVFIVGLGF